MINKKIESGFYCIINCRNYFSNVCHSVKKNEISSPCFQGKKEAVMYKEFNLKNLDKYSVVFLNSDSTINHDLSFLNY